MLKFGKKRNSSRAPSYAIWCPASYFLKFRIGAKTHIDDELMFVVKIRKNPVRATK